MPTPQFVAASSVSTSVSGTTNAVGTMPASAVAGQYALMLISHSGVSTLTLPTNYGTWQVVNEASPASQVRASLYGKFVASGEPGQSVPIVSSGAQRIGIAIAVYRDTLGVGVVNNRPETEVVDTHPVPSVTAPAGGVMAVTCAAERSTNASTVWTQPATYTLRTSAFATLTGANAVAIADRSNILVAGGASFGTGNWVADVANDNVSTFTVGLTPSSSTALAITSFTVVPARGPAPHTVTATCVSSGGNGNAKQHTFNWRDGTTTGPQTSGTATHTYNSPGTYTQAVNQGVYVDLDQD